MGKVLILGILALALGGGCYWLYTNGFFSTKAKAAILYVSTPPLGRFRTGWQVTFQACSGMESRILPLTAGKAYRFDLSPQITRGSVRVELQGKDGQILFTLNQARPSCTLLAKQSCRYRLTARFQEADGSFELRWHET